MKTITELKEYQKYPDFAFHIGTIAETEAAQAHSHDCVNLLVVTGGNELYTVEPYTFIAIPGSVYGAAGNTVHCFNKNSSAQGYSILFDPSVLGDSLDELTNISGYNKIIPQTLNNEGDLSNFLLEPKHYEEIIFILQKLQEEYYSANASFAMIRSLLVQLIIELCRCYVGRKKTKPEAMNLLRDDKTIFDTAINEKMLISQMAAKSGISEQHFRRLFHKVYGTSPLNHLHLRKVINAKKMILENKYSITEIAMRCGFCNSSHMSRVFKKIEGMSPREYKKMYL
ncbi:MAG: helix-turn-helix domain-containing protein [Clostridia bacterium]|nr:helix-turn-helix domain-containing protein [Clostridia bacterium]MBR2973642.1 helix-turn-helix domain-containing protein [Clostridia bacterium]MBR3576716.1 helix-turn-helix domain-containing protein [Clostridia bacterium]